MDEHTEEVLKHESNEVALTVRMPSGTVDRIDRLVKARLTKIPRHSWLLEAIYEKLNKEERVEGVLDIFWENNAEPRAAAMYRLRFLSFLRKRGGPIAPMTVVGDNCLERYLVDWGFDPDIARGWIQKLKKDTSVSIPNVMMPADRIGPYGFKIAGLGIQMRLTDGRTAVLYHDHPRNAPREVKGDRIVVIGASGNVEEEATVTAEGRVLILIEKHIFPPQASNTVHLEFREASTDERGKFLGIHRLYVVD